MAVAASFVDPYLAILRDDSTLLLLQADESGDLDEVVLSEDISTKKWLSSCVYYDHNGCFSMVDPASEKSSRRTVLLFLLSSDCRLFVSLKEPLKFATPKLMKMVRCSNYLTRSYCQSSKVSIACSLFCPMNSQNDQPRGRF